jgi:protein tyrosine phosphatase
VSGLHVAIRTFIIEQGELKKEVVQIHVVDWPDHGVPQEASVLIDLIQLARSHAVRLGGPMVVHCSAGVGRTGTFCVADSLMARLEHQPEVGEEDMVYNQVLALRQKRIIMVQTFVQYVYCYQVLKEWLMKQ